MIQTNEEGVMKKQFSPSTWKEGDWVVAQCLEVDVASQEASEGEVLDNLRDALERHFQSPFAT